MAQFISRAGLKLDHALNAFAFDVTGMIAADLGCNAGGFTDCLLQRGAARVYAVDTGYGALDWKLRKNPHVVVMERTNAMHVTLAERVGLVAIDVAWTRQRHILPAAGRMLGDHGRVISLIKPHYEAPASMLRRGVLPPESLDAVLTTVRADLVAAGFTELQCVKSPITGTKGNIEMLVLLKRSDEA